MNEDDLVEMQINLYRKAVAEAVGQATSVADDYLPSGRELAKRLYDAGGWKKIPPPETKSVLNRNNPPTQEERMKAYELYYAPEEPEQGGFYRFIDGEVEVVDCADAYVCIAYQLNRLLRQSVDSEGVNDSRWLI